MTDPFPVMPHSFTSLSGRETDDSTSRFSRHEVAHTEFMLQFFSVRLSDVEIIERYRTRMLTRLRRTNRPGPFWLSDNLSTLYATQKEAHEVGPSDMGLHGTEFVNRRGEPVSGTFAVRSFWNSSQTISEKFKWRGLINRFPRLPISPDCIRRERASRIHIRG
jgi:hypothetical protein